MVNWSDAVLVGGGRSSQVADLSRALVARGHEVEELDARSASALSWGSQVDVVHAHGYQANFVALASLALRGRRGPVAVATLHGWHHGRMRYRTLNAAERALLWPFREISVPAHAMLAQLPASVRARAVVVHNGVPPVRCPPRRASAASIAWVGRLAPEKRPELAVEVLRRARQRMPHLELHVIGPAADPKTQLETARRARLSGGRVAMWGARRSPWQTVPVDIVIHTSRYEGLSRVLLEAMSAGLPVVASDVGGTREAVIDGVTGFLCPPDAVDDYVERIVQLASSAELRAAMGAAARQRYERQFTVEAMAAKIEALYRRALA